MLTASFNAPPATLNPASAADDCPAPTAIKDPFSDFDDLKTEEEKREALHEDLDRELAKHKKRCDKKQTTASQSAQSAASANGGQSGAQQAEGQQSASENGSNNAQSQNSNSSQSQSQSEGQSQSQSQGQSDPNSSASQQQQSTSQQQQQQQQQQSTSQQQSASQQQQSSGQQQQSASQQQSGSAAAQAQQTGTYSSPWATRQSSAAGSGQVMLEPMAEPTRKEPDPAQQAGQSGTSQAATEPAGAGGQTEKQESVFLQTYGGQQSLESEKIEDIAGRHKTNQPYWSPGSTGAVQQQPFYSDPGKKPGQASTVSAEDTVLAALKKRLAEETDPAKKKEIQAQIDRYQKK